MVYTPYEAQTAIINPSIKSICGSVFEPYFAKSNPNNNNIPHMNCSVFNWLDTNNVVNYAEYPINLTGNRINDYQEALKELLLDLTDIGGANAARHPDANHRYQYLGLNFQNPGNTATNNYDIIKVLKGFVTRGVLSINNANRLVFNKQLFGQRREFMLGVGVILIIKEI